MNTPDSICAHENCGKPYSEHLPPLMACPDGFGDFIRDQTFLPSEQQPEGLKTMQAILRNVNEASEQAEQKPKFNQVDIAFMEREEIRDAWQQASELVRRKDWIALFGLFEFRRRKIPMRQELDSAAPAQEPDKDSKHTAGPWIAKHTYQSGWQIWSESAKEIICTEKSYGWRDSDEHKANAELIARAPDLLREVEKLHKFKDYVHKRLDDAGIEKNPDGEHSKHGCRIGDRLDIVLREVEQLKFFIQNESQRLADSVKERDLLQAKVDRLTKALEVVPAFKLRALATWLDIKDYENGDDPGDVQADLRKMADLSEQSLNPRKP